MIWLMVRKELLELRRSPVLLLSMISLPATVVAVPVLLLGWLLERAPEQALAFVQEFYGVKGTATVTGVASVLAQNWLPMFLVLPVFLPILIAAQSIGGERERRTLEPLLATPVSTTSKAELIVCPVRSHTASGTAMVIATMPAASNTPMPSQRYQVKQRTATTAVAVYEIHCAGAPAIGYCAPRISRESANGTI